MNGLEIALLIGALGGPASELRLHPLSLQGALAEGCPRQHVSLTLPRAKKRHYPQPRGTAFGRPVLSMIDTTHVGGRWCLRGCVRRRYWASTRMS